MPLRLSLRFAISIAPRLTPLEVIVGETNTGRAILGVVDGLMPKGIENKEILPGARNFCAKSVISL